jgi:hypothetical protein
MPFTLEVDIGEVVFSQWYDEDKGETRKVVGACATCYRGQELPKTINDVMLVSPGGVAHHTDDQYGDRTFCGHDATGPDWWWRL